MLLEEEREDDDEKGISETSSVGKNPIIDIQVNYPPSDENEQENEQEIEPELEDEN